jgi:hypothetical protein
MTEWDTKYMPALRAGEIEWSNPFNCNQRKMVSLRPFPGFFILFFFKKKRNNQKKNKEGPVVCLALWSKNYGPFMRSWSTKLEDHAILSK